MDTTQLMMQMFQEVFATISANQTRQAVLAAASRIQAANIGLSPKECVEKAVEMFTELDKLCLCCGRTVEACDAAQKAVQGGSLN